MQDMGRNRGLTLRPITDTTPRGDIGARLASVSKRLASIDKTSFLLQRAQTEYTISDDEKGMELQHL